MQNKNGNVLCYLRTHRRVWGLTQPELASLLGLGSASYLSRIEHGKYAPKIEVAIACQVLFGITPSAMFPHVYFSVEEDVVRKVYGYHLTLGNTKTLSGLRKLQLCEFVLKRAVTKNSHLEGL